MKRILKCITFIIIFAIIWKTVFDVLWLQENSIGAFYNEPRNSLDVIYIGASNAHHHFNPLLAYDLYGFTTGLLSTGIQPFVMAKYLIKEAEKYQKPSLYVIDLTRLPDDLEKNFNVEFSRQVIDMFKFNKNRIDLINETLKVAKIPKKEYINYYFSFFLYHNSWKNIEYANFYNNLIYKGYYFADSTMNIVPQEEYYWNDDMIELQSDNKRILIDLINYITSNKLNVLFVIPKRTYWYPDQQRLNHAVYIIEKNGLPVINFNKIEDVGLDFKTDFYDSGHLNVYGAIKYTSYFSKYLKENYNLKNHKGDKLYSSWNQEYEIFKYDFENRTNQKLNSFLMKNDS